jgi:hypothetical protein
MRRFTLVVAIAAVAAVALVASAGAGPSTTVTISWAFVGDGATPPSIDGPVLECPFVPDGMWVLGTGSWTLLAPAGDAGNITSFAHGTAVDSAGNTYRWNYRQSIQPNGDASESQVVDDFVLAGGGPAGGIRSHFIATIDGTSLEDATSFDLKQLTGDPFECDPI